MSAAFCSFCGKPVPAGAAFCPSCGAAVSDAPPAGVPYVAQRPMPPSTPFGYTPLPWQPGSYSPGGSSRATDLAALSRVTLAAVLAIAGELLGVVILTLNNVASLIAVTNTSSGLTISLPSPWIWAGYLLGIAVLALTEILLFRSAFHGIAVVDRTFSTPASLAIVAFVGVTLALLGLALFLQSLYSAVSCAGSGVPIPSSCLLSNTFWGGVALLGLGGLLAFVGYIGVLLGIWRLGTRYADAMFKVGAILLIIPYINLIGAILILVGARTARRKVEGAGGWTPTPG